MAAWESPKVLYMLEKGKETSQPDSVTWSPCSVRDDGNDDTAVTSPTTTTGYSLGCTYFSARLSARHFVPSFTITDMLWDIVLIL